MPIASITGILAVGDCNTLGAAGFVGNSYPERVGRQLQLPVRNCGYTMSTSREGYYLLHDHLTAECSSVIIQFGLRDSSLTFRYAPYVMYYPDNFLRKPCRHILKKIKKMSRKYGLNKRLGETHVVPLDEYRSNISRMVAFCGNRMVLLPETIPHHDSWRNEQILVYNSALAEIAAQHPTCHLVQTYSAFANNLDGFYADATHANGAGHDFIASKIIETVGG
jgi:hypothetical protein